MYRLEHYIKNTANKQFIVVDDEHNVFAIGDTGACYYNPMTVYTVTAHATTREINNLRDILLARGYQKYNAKNSEDMQEFRSIVQGK